MSGIVQTLRDEYPLLTKDGFHTMNTFDNIYENLRLNINKTKNNEEGLAYLDEAETFLQNTYLENITKLKNKRMDIERTTRFDMIKLKNLPADIIYEISTWLEPEIKYSRAFMVLQRYGRSTNWSLGGMETHLWYVPKKIIIFLKDSCAIWFHDYTKNSEPKANFCDGIRIYLRKLILDKDTMGVDKLLVEYNSERGTKRLDKIYKFFLYIEVYLKYRKELEAKNKNTNGKLKALKNNKIEVK